LAYIPSLLVAAAVIIVGWLVARLLRLAAVRSIERIDWLLTFGRIQRRGEKTASSPAFKRAVGSIVFWAVLLSFVAAALRSLDLEVIDDWTASLLNYLPILIGGLFIVLFAIAAGSVVRQIIEPAAESFGAVNSQFAGRLSQIAIVATGVVIGTGVLGIDVSFVIQLTTVIVGVALGGVVLALALGTREHLANLVGIRYVRKHYRTGEYIRVGEHSGRIIEIADGCVFLDTPTGDVSIPGSYFAREPFVKLDDESSHEE